MTSTKSVDLSLLKVSVAGIASMLRSGASAFVAEAHGRAELIALIPAGFMLRRLIWKQRGAGTAKSLLELDFIFRNDGSRPAAGDKLKSPKTAVRPSESGELLVLINDRYRLPLIWLPSGYSRSDPLEETGSEFVLTLKFA